MINLNGNSSSSRQVIFTIRPSIQSKALASYLSETLMTSAVLQNADKPLTQCLAKDSVMLLGIAVSNRKSNRIRRDIIQLWADNPCLLITDSAQKYELYEMAQWPALYGVFRHNDDESCLIEGVKAVLNGEQMTESSVIHSTTYAVDHVSAPVENSPLTERECKILSELRYGATNLNIARALFISENTMHTHLYNVSRRLSVKNHTQAVSWVSEHLRH